MSKNNSSRDGALTRTGVIYARVSTKQQEEEGYSIPAQQELLRRYAAEKGITVIRDFTDVETAKQKGRKAFGEMLAFLRKTTTCRALLVEKTDRLHRNIQDYAIIDALVNDGLEVHFVKEHEVIRANATSQAKLLYGMKAVIAKNHIDNLSEETIKGMLEKARQGMWPSFAPLGYLNVEGPSLKRIMVRDPKLAPIIARMYQLYATGRYSLKQIAAVARADGFAYRKSGDTVPVSTVHKILRNRIYSGDFDFDGKTYTGTYEPIVSRELWDQVQAVLDGRGTKKTRKMRETFAFSGLLTCGHCGCAMVGEMKKGKYTYYHCTGFKGKCQEPYTREEVLEERFAGLLKAITFSEDTLGWVRRALRESHSDEKEFHDEAITRLQRDHRRVQDRIDRMYEDKLDGRIDNAFFDAKATEMRAEQARIMRDVAAHQTANRCYIEEGVQILELAQRAHALFENQPPSEKRKLVNFVLSNCTWKGGELTTQYRQPFDAVAVAVAADKQRVAEGSAKTGPK